jgi:putative phage-type endonuclease
VTVPYRKLAPASLDVTDHAAWLMLRRGGIGGSDAPAVLGLDGYRTRWQVWVDKVSGDVDVFTDDQREALEFGHDMEALIARRWGRHRHGRGARVARCGTLARKDKPWMRVNLDRLVTGCPLNDGPCLLECKNRSAFQAAQWSRDGDIEKVPDGPVIQTQHALMVTGFTHGHLAAEIGQRLHAYIVPADARLQKTLAEEEEWFWHDHVLAGTPPPIDGTERTGKILARLWDADPDLIVPATAGQLATVERLRRMIVFAAEAAEAAEAVRHELQQQMGEAEILAHPDTGKPVATWKRNGAFVESRYRVTRRRVPAAWQRTVRRIVPESVADADPDGYRAARARVFRLSAPPKEGT